MQPFEVIDVPARIGLVADTHRRSGSLAGLPAKLLDGLDGCDVILHAGDLNTMLVFDELSRMAPVYGVHGNNDEADVLMALPAERFFRAGDCRLGLIHGHQAARNARSAAVYAMTGRVDCVIYGHSHMPDCSREDGLLLVNPGSPTQRRRAPSRSFAIMSIDAASTIDVEFVEVT